jgi:hypothetical protein
VVGGEEQDSGVRIQEAEEPGAGDRAMLNCESWIVSCLLTSRHCRLPTGAMKTWSLGCG